jgi:hypothetical protein
MISCFAYAATMFRPGAAGPQLALLNAPVLFATPDVALNQWFAPVPGNPITLHDLALGDLILFSATKGHVAVATGSGDQVLQSWYHVWDMGQAVRLRQLLEEGRQGAFGKIPTRATWVEQLKPIPAAAQRLMDDRDDLGAWPDGPTSTRLQYLSYIFELYGVLPLRFRLKAEARTWIDATGPLAPYVNASAASLSRA